MLSLPAVTSYPTRSHLILSSSSDPELVSGNFSDDEFGSKMPTIPQAFLWRILIAGLRLATFFIAPNNTIIATVILVITRGLNALDYAGSYG
ncbi:MAG: hypothetical protein L6R41_000928 [Letrouitia leprolyta]|nr:MAG: hypothetical protein L6R41_000928 [Letrouitia leprolyta]